MLEEIIKDINDFVNQSQELAESHEKFKEKGLACSIQDLFNWLELSETICNMATSGKSMYMENYKALDVLKWQRRIDLKAELDENWKKKYTESTADAVINKEFEDEWKALNTLKTAYELLLNIANHIPEYINLVKLDMRTLNPLQWIPWE